MNQSRYQNRSTIEDFINPLNGYRGKLEAQGKQVKNHMKANRAALKTAADKATHKREMESQVGPDPFKMRKF